MDLVCTTIEVSALVWFEGNHTAERSIMGTKNAKVLPASTDRNASAYNEHHRGVWWQIRYHNIETHDDAKMLGDTADRNDWRTYIAQIVSTSKETG